MLLCFEKESLHTEIEIFVTVLLSVFCWCLLKIWNLIVGVGPRQFKIICGT